MKNFNLERMESATKAMVEVSKSLIEFNRVWDELTVPEKWATGGIVYHISSVWGSFSSMGALAQPPVAESLVNTLSNFIYHPEMFPKPKVNKPKTE